jgi:hypothetical protein
MVACEIMDFGLKLDVVHANLNVWDKSSDFVKSVETKGKKSSISCVTCEIEFDFALLIIWVTIFLWR